MKTRSKREESNKISKHYQQKHLQVKIIINEISTENNVEPYSLPDLMSLRDRLNSSKSKLDPYYVGSKSDKELESAWWRFQSIIDIYKMSRFEIEKKFNAKHVTNAWLKYWELYSHYIVVPEKMDRPYRAFFNAELPGAALCAFNHYMKTMRTGEYDWRASSLAPDGDDARTTLDAFGDSYGLYEKNKSKWLMTFANDKTENVNNGDATVVKNLLDFADKIGPDSKWKGVDLYSSDAGIDASTDDSGNLAFNRQESINAKLHLGCALSGFLTLRKGGAFIAKQYTFFETFTWNLILIYATLFDEFYICKPLASRPYNSETYLIGKGFRGLDEKTKKLLIDRLENFNMNPLIPPQAIKTLFSTQTSEIQNFARVVFGQQISFIDENVELFNNYRNRLGVLKNGLEQLKSERIASWLKLYPVKRIEDADQLPSN